MTDDSNTNSAPVRREKTISRANPQPALDALVGRVYEFKGRTIRNSNMAMLALAKCGVPLEEVQRRPFEALPVAIYAMMQPAGECLQRLALGAEAFRASASEWFDAQVSAEEHGEALAILTECIERFAASLTRYHARDAKSGNSPAAADIS